MPTVSRFDIVRKACKEAGIDAFLVRETPNIAWLTQFDDVFDSEQAHALWITPTKAVLHTDSRYAHAALNASQQRGEVAVNDVRQTHAAFVAQSVEQSYLEGTPVPVLGIENSCSLAEFRLLETELTQQVQPNHMPRLEETAGFIRNLRAVKDASEIERMREAQAITDAAFAHLIEYVQPGLIEREVQIELDDFMRRKGAEGLAFPSIVAAGEHAASPHAVPGTQKLEAGQCIVFDFGAVVRGYCSDMTRCIFLGEPTAKQKDAYAAIRSANETVEAVLKPGVTGKEMHELAEKVLAEAGFANTMGHSLGHGVGREIHEEPNLSPKNEKPLIAGNVVTVEPGIYLSGEFGMRLEDFGVVTDTGFEVFTQSPHDMIIL